MNNLTYDRMKGILKGTDQGKPQIMIVDDEESVRRLLSRMLKMNGDTCTLAADAKEARAFLKDQKFDLILCDVNMPGESGIDFIRYVLSEYPETAAIMVTAVDDPEVAESTPEVGAYTDDAIVHHGVLVPGLNFLEKPFTPEGLALKIREVLDDLK